MKRNIVLALVLLAAFATTGIKYARAAPTDGLLPFDGGIGWINSKPLTPEELRGKVVLVDFWEYTCINCLRTLPYLREWYRRYSGNGFVIVGVHSPEFTFSGDPKNVAAAVKHLDVTWPVVLDTNHTVWNRYRNNTWPHEFLYDPHGKLVESTEGEGGYQATEAKIQALLAANDPGLHLPPVMPLLPQDSYTKPGAVCYPRTPEILVRKAANANPLANLTGGSRYNDDTSTHRDGAIYLQGYWNAGPQAMVSAGGPGYLYLKYHAIQVVSVMKPETDAAVTVIVTQDGKPVPRQDAGEDVHYDPQGSSYVTVDAPRAYGLIMNARFGQHELRLMPQRLGLGVYSFDFESCEVSADK
jgi:thiol-disulfide isomerase/thioredoxin